MLPSLKVLLVWVMTFMGAAVAKEGDKESNFKAYLEWAHENLEVTRKKGETLQQELTQEEEEKLSCPSQKCSPESSSISDLERPINLENQQEKILIFVSFSMPEASLKSLAQEAVNHNAVLIIRGLLEDNFKITAERLKDYAQGLEVNPELFEKYAIQHVPTFVKVKGDQEKARLSGNVTLSFATQQLKDAS